MLCAERRQKPESGSFVLTETEVNSMKSVLDFFRHEDGATAIEYALMAALIALAIVAGVQSMGTQLSTSYVEIGNALK
jgi:pilus assembly protein Flp/PilA